MSVRNKDSRGQPLFLARTDYRVTAKPGKLYFTFLGAQRNPFTLPHMQNAVTRTYRLADSAPFEVREVHGEKQLTTTGLMNTDPMATVIVVEIEGSIVRK
jgi:alpha-L-fucosidase